MVVESLWDFAGLTAFFNPLRQCNLHLLLFTLYLFIVILAIIYALFVHCYP